MILFALNFVFFNQLNYLIRTALALIFSEKHYNSNSELYIYLVDQESVYCYEQVNASFSSDNNIAYRHNNKIITFAYNNEQL